MGKRPEHRAGEIVISKEGPSTLGPLHVQERRGARHGARRYAHALGGGCARSRLGGSTELKCMGKHQQTARCFNSRCYWYVQYSDTQFACTWSIAGMLIPASRSCRAVASLTMLWSLLLAHCLVFCCLRSLQLIVQAEALCESALSAGRGPHLARCYVAPLGCIRDRLAHLLLLKLNVYRHAAAPD